MLAVLPRAWSAASTNARFQVCRAFATVVPKITIDGGQKLQDILERIDKSSSSYAQTVDLVAVGQSGIMATLHAAANLRKDSAAPPFILRRSATANREQGVSEPAGESRETADESSSQRIWHLTLPPATEWRTPPMPRPEEKLLVGNKTQILSLAKAIAARAAQAPEGEGVCVETYLLGDERVRRYRVSVIAEALSRVYHWQTFPTLENKPTRLFKCFAHLSQETEQKSQKECWALRIEVRPEGKPKEWS